MTLYQLLCELLCMGKIASYTRRQSSDKTQRLLRPQARLQQVRAAHMGTFRAGGHSNLAAHKQLFTVEDRTWQHAGAICSQLMTRGPALYLFFVLMTLYTNHHYNYMNRHCSNTPNELNC